MNRSSAADRVIARFAERSRDGGPRNVVMSEVARSLGMSTATLYRAFPTKADVVAAMVEQWVREFAAKVEAAKARHGDPAERILLLLVRSWTAMRNRLSKNSWEQIRTDYPDAFVRFEEGLSQATDLAREVVRPRMRNAVDPDIAEFLLTSSLTALLERPLHDRLGRSFDQAVDDLVHLWSTCMMTD